MEGQQPTDEPDQVDPADQPFRSKLTKGIRDACPPCEHPSSALAYSAILFAPSNWGCGECLEPMADAPAPSPSSFAVLLEGEMLDRISEGGGTPAVPACHSAFEMRRRSEAVADGCISDGRSDPGSVARAWEDVSSRPNPNYAN